MKKSIFILMTVILGMTACKEKEVETNNNSSNIAVEYDGSGAGFPIEIKTGRMPVNEDESCTGQGACGPCFSICILFKWGKKKKGTIVNLTDELREANVQCDGTLLTLSFLEPAEIDNGNGTTTLDENFNIGSEVSNLLGFNDVIIQAGNYIIDYSNNPYGTVTMSVITN